jgi:hypothetical protein
MISGRDNTRPREQRTQLLAIGGRAGQQRVLS